MLNRLIVILFFILFPLFQSVYANTLQAPKQSSKTIQLASGEWRPFLSKDLPHYGYASHIVSEAFSMVGITVEYEFLPWKRAEHSVKKGVLHGSVVWSYREDREQWALYSQPVIVETVVLFHSTRLPSVEWSKIEDLRGMKVSVALGSSAPTFEAASKDGILRLLKSGDIGSNFKMLLRGRTDIFPLIKSVGDYYLRTQFSEDMRQQITFSPTIFTPQEYHLILSKEVPGNVELLQQFNQGLKKLKESGRYQALEEQFNQGAYDG